MNEQWTEQMRQKMADYRRPAPEVSWEKIDRVLTARKPRLLWLRRVAAAAVVLLIAGVGWWWLESPPQPSLQATHSSSPYRQHTTALTIGREPRQGEQEGGSTPQKDETTMPRAVAHSLKSAVSTDEPESTVSSGTPITANSQTTTEKGQRQTGDEKKEPANHTHHFDHPARLHRRRPLDNRLTAKVYLSNSLNDSRQSASFIQKEIMIADGENHLISNVPEIFEDTIATILTSHIDQHVHHRQPVRFGLSLRYRLDERWSLEGGLTYTRLSSDITTNVDGETTITEQRLNYIGLPMNVSYDLWSSQHFGFYISMGTTIEKRLDASPWQFSLNGAAGVEYKLTDVLSLYAEPGIGYYIPDGSTTATIYQDRPLNFNLSLGLRFHLR